ncbi:MAG: hypothetical protein F6K40_06950 [Okeania sp. SIO3I5]|uniref:hypothetical protein n=1 Tax=Okeania sp. SIO3I5 TaxID=2607805 RepID=UPI0013B7768D|nr:hypothetical protein [Okeania sp. SIO3I5]NEQ36035.1 hypothetical protein [Okeania sp. SIO3I5]
MNEELTISNTPPEHPGMDFTGLREEGIQHIQELGSQIWTDYNTHDPGITILEQFCYVITDLSYRLNFEMKDLLTPHPEDAEENIKQFYTAREILSVNPLTINDYREILIDIDGVKNAELKPIEHTEPYMFYDKSNHSLTVNSTEENGERVYLKGLYEVIIELDEKITRDAKNLKKEVASKLNEHRNLCEYFFGDVTILEIEEITVEAHIDIEDDSNETELMQKVYDELYNYISPRLEFYSLKELQDEGRNTEDIFEGYPLEHGFIKDEEFDILMKKKALYTSELIEKLLKIEGIKTIRSISLLSSFDPEQEPQKWVLPLAPNQTPRLNDDIPITFYKRNRSYPLEIDNNDNNDNNDLELSESGQQAQDIPIPVGEYRELSDYESIQNEFPVNYGIGEFGLPASATTERKSQAKQLQAYLMFFDQILANYFTQLDHTKDLFSFQNEDNQTYFPQDISSFPGADEILNSNGSADKQPEDLWKEKEINLERKSRFLDYLMAQFCEKFTDPSLLLYKSKISPEAQQIQLLKDLLNFLKDLLKLQNAIPLKLLNEIFFNLLKEVALRFNIKNKNQEPISLLNEYIQNETALLNLKQQIKDKINFLQNYPQISAGRGQAFDCTNSQEVWDTDNVSGLKKRICALLGMPYDRVSLSESDEIEGFHLIEHILLPVNQDEFFTVNLGYPISKFETEKEEEENETEKVTCTSEKHGLSNDEAIQIFDSGSYNDDYTVRNVAEDTFNIEKEFSAEPKTGKWIHKEAHKDPFSFQISFVFPDWIGRFKDKDFRNIVYDIITAETPAHITPYIHWFGKGQMEYFESVYFQWLDEIMNGTNNNINLTNEMIKLLSIDKFHGIGYMMICGEDEDCEENEDCQLNEKLEKFKIIPDKYDPLKFEG